MKKNLLLIIALVVVGSSAFAQDIPNKDMENWVVAGAIIIGTDTIPYYNPTDWSTPNLYTGLAGKIVVEPDDNAYSGEKCAKLTSKNMELFPIIAPGCITLGKFQINMQTMSGEIIGGIDFNGKPTKLKGYFKYQPADIDTAQAYLYLTRWDADNNVTITLGYAYFEVVTAVEEWTEFEAIVEYFFPEDTPDTMNVVIMSSVLLGGNDGSVMYVDDLSIELESGIDYDLMPEVRVNVYPNPATDIIYFEFARRIDQGRMIFYNTVGAHLKDIEVNESGQSFDISNFPAGTYYFHLMEGKARISSGSFVVK